MSISAPAFLTWQNLTNVSRQVAVVGLLSLGQFAVMLTGNIDLSSAALMGLFGAVLADAPPWAARGIRATNAVHLPAAEPLALPCPSNVVPFLSMFAGIVSASSLCRIARRA